MIFKPLNDELADLEMLVLMIICIPFGLVLGLPSYFEHRDGT